MSPSTRHRSPANIDLVASNWILRRDAGLTSAEEAEFAQWQAEDPRHADAVARKAQAWSALDRPLYAGQADRLIERLNARAVKRRRRRIGASLAGVAALCVAAFTYTQAPRGSAPAAAPLVASARGVVILPESQTLPDGSRIELRPGAEVAIDFGGTLRRVLLKKGEAYFQVAHDERRPFVVTAGTVEFRALGTAFSVGLGSEQVDLLVTEGRVGVDESATPQRTPAAEIAASPKIATVGAGHRLEVDLVAPLEKSPPRTPVTADEISERLAWRAPKLEFSELPLGEAVVLINRFNKTHFVIDDATLAGLHISGLFRADNIDTFVRLLEATCGIEAKRDGAVIRLKKAGH
jgi:transmembrane sensor